MFRTYTGNVNDLFNEDFFRDFFGIPSPKRQTRDDEPPRKAPEPEPQWQTTRKVRKFVPVERPTKIKVEDDEQRPNDIEIKVKRQPASFIDSVTCGEKFKELFENMFGGKVKVETVPGKSEPPKALRELIDEQDDEQGDFNDDEINDDEIEEEPPSKNPFVFMANRLTFLIKTSQPIIWDTSAITTPTPDSMFVAFADDDNPQLDFKKAAKIAYAVNNDSNIQKEIAEYLDGSDFRKIVCIPNTQVLGGVERLGFLFMLMED